MYIYIYIFYYIRDLIAFVQHIGGGYRLDTNQRPSIKCIIY